MWNQPFGIAAISGQATSNKPRMAEAISIERRISVKYGDQLQWVVEPTVIDGRDFVTISQRNSAFRKFITGSTNQVQMPWLDKLKQMRTKATLNIVESEADGLFDGNVAAAQKAKKYECMRMQQLGTMPATVAVKMPAIAHMPARQIYFVTSLDASAIIQMEMTVEALEYIKMFATTSVDEPPPKKRRCSGHAGVYWRNSKWVAVRKDEHGNKKYKYFKPVIDDDDDAADESAAAAAEWIQKGDDQQDENDDVNAMG